MNKKEANRKIVTQNRRNRIINKRYTSTIKTLTKLFNLKIKNIDSEGDLSNKEKLKTEIFLILKNLYSIIDKAVKKNVIHKNKANRKKSKIGKLFSKFQY
jgi:small subunit ribosomal protein S20